MNEGTKTLLLTMMDPVSGVRTSTIRPAGSTLKANKRTFERAFLAQDGVVWLQAHLNASEQEAYARLLSLVQESWLTVALFKPAKTAERILDYESVLQFGEAVLALEPQWQPPQPPLSTSPSISPRKGTLHRALGKLTPTGSLGKAMQPPSLPPMPSMPPQAPIRPPPPQPSKRINSPPQSPGRSSFSDAGDGSPMITSASALRERFAVDSGDGSLSGSGNLAGTPPISGSSFFSPNTEDAEAVLDFEMARRGFELDKEILLQDNRELQRKVTGLEDQLRIAEDRYAKDITGPLVVGVVQEREKKIRELEAALAEEREARNKLRARLDAAQLYETVATSLQAEVDRLKHELDQRKGQQAILVVHTVDTYAVEAQSLAPDESPVVTTTTTLVDVPPNEPLSPSVGERSRFVGQTLVLSPDGKELHAATIDRLLGYLVEQTVGTNDLNVFLHTYRSFLTPMGLLKRLMGLYCKSSKRTHWLRIVSILSHWIKKSPDDFLNAELTRTLDAFLDKFVSRTQSEALVDKLRRLLEPAALQAAAVGLLPPPPALQANARLSSVVRVDDLLDLDPVTLADQLIMCEWEYFRAIKSEDCFNQTWTSRSAHVQEVSARFNAVSSWVAWRVLQDRDRDARAAVVDFMVGVATECRQRNAFHVMMEVVSGLSCQPVYRLQRTWEAVTSMTNLDELRRLCSADRNFGGLRTATRDAELPCFPYIGTFLSDLLFIEQGNPTTLHGMLNFHKMRRMYSVIEKLERYQSQPYSYARIPAAISLLLDIKQVSEDELFKRSWAVEMHVEK